MNAVLHNRIFTAPMLWTAGEAEAATNGISTQQWVASNITVESSSISPGDLFVHINEDDFDSLLEAFRKGAVAAVVSAVPARLQGKVPFLIVEDTFKALYDLAAVARLKAMEMEAIAISGSLGKSSIRSMLALALGRQGVTQSKQVDYFSTHIGLPLALANTHSNTKYGLYEFGVTRHGEAYAFSKQTQPTIAIITNIMMPNHDHFESFRDMAKEYATVFHGMNTNGTVILNADCPYYPDLVAEARTQGIKRIWGFGGSKHAHARLIDIKDEKQKQIVTFEILGERYRATIPYIGKFMAYNMLASLLAVAAAKGNIEFAIQQIEKMRPLAGRGKSYSFNIGDAHNPLRVIDETSHLCPVSIENSLDRMAHETTGKGGRKILVIGDMPGIQMATQDIYEDIAERAEQNGIQIIYGCGTMPETIKTKNSFSDVHELNADIESIFKPGDTVLITGGRHNALRHTITKLQSIHFTYEDSKQGPINDISVFLWNKKALAANDG